jgi:hypothetical protein
VHDYRPKKPEAGVRAVPLHGRAVLVQVQHDSVVAADRVP